MTQKLPAVLFVEKPVLSMSSKRKAHQAEHQGTTVIFFDCEDTVLQEFVPPGQTVQPALPLGGFATSEEGSPPKMYRMIAEQGLVDSL